jgi:hypothetical protein
MSFSTRSRIPPILGYLESTQTSLSYRKKRNISMKLTVEMDFSKHKTITQVEMDFSKHKTMKQVEMDFSMTMQETVEQVKATEMVIMTVLTMIQITICPTLTTVKAYL